MNNINIKNNTIKYIAYIIIAIIGVIIFYFIYKYLSQQYTIIL